MDEVYLDNNATTRLCPEALEAMRPYLTDWYGNPSSVHRFGQRARQGIDEARSQVAEFLSCSPSEIMFSGGGTESINTAVRGIAAIRGDRKRIITTPVEHSAMRELAQQMQREGFEIVWLTVDQAGHLDLDQLRAALNDSTALVSVMWANNETGVLFPIEEIAALCRSHKVPFHCDGTQALGKIPVDVVAAGVDAMSFAPHKFHGPKGVGGLYLRRGMRMKPLVFGGPHETNRRGGTENVPGIVGTGVAAEMARQSLAAMPRIAALRDELEKKLLIAIPDAHVIGDPSRRVGNTTNIGFARLEADAIVISLSEQGVYVSAGSACSSGSLEPSHVLTAMGIDPRIAHGGIRFSLSKFTTPHDIDRALAVVPAVINKLREVLPVGSQ